jgi:hypothetical protein
LGWAPQPRNRPVVRKLRAWAAILARRVAGAEWSIALRKDLQAGFEAGASGPLIGTVGRGATLNVARPCAKPGDLAARAAAGKVCEALGKKWRGGFRLLLHAQSRFKGGMAEWFEVGTIAGRTYLSAMSMNSERSGSRLPGDSRYWACHRGDPGHGQTSFIRGELCQYADSMDRRATHLAFPRTAGRKATIMTPPTEIEVLV